MKRAYRYGYTSYFSNIKLPELITNDLIVQKLEQLRAGDMSVRDDLIIHYLRLVFAIVGRIKANYPQRKHNDLLGSGLLALIECLDSIAKGKGMQAHDNLDAYVHKTIYHEIREFIKTDWIVRPPLNSDWLIAKIEAEGSECLTDLFGTTEYFELSEPTGDSYENVNITNTGRTHGLNTPSPQGLIELRDLLDSFYFTPIEKTIILLRVEGITMKEIGERLGISKVAVHKRLNETIIPRLKQLL